jgi:hypothetical protein
VTFLEDLGSEIWELSINRGEIEGYYLHLCRSPTEIQRGEICRIAGRVKWALQSFKLWIENPPNTMQNPATKKKLPNS